MGPPPDSFVIDTKGLTPGVAALVADERNHALPAKDLAMAAAWLFYDPQRAPARYASANVTRMDANALTVIFERQMSKLSQADVADVMAVLHGRPGTTTPSPI